LTTGAVVAFEALSRFEGGFRPEERFREAARLGLGCELEQLAVEIILDEARHFDDSVPISVNLSPASIFVPAIKDLITGVGRSLTVEITEHDRVDSYEQLIEEIRGLSPVRLSVDDAGSGYASLQHIFRLRPNYVKLDREWVREIDRDRPRQVLVRGLLSFVGELGGVLVAEGVERVEEADVLRGLGVPYAQGFLFAEPAPAASFPSTLVS
jgi:EAL domain-containing protein (putative c-di-GMP-specific phosphodiesterase class I)